MKKRRILSFVIASVLFASMMLMVCAEPVTATVESVTAQLEAIDSLEQMQKKRASFTASGRYDITTTNTTIIAAHNAAQKNYKAYVEEMFAARAAAQAAYDSLSAAEQAQIDAALVAKLEEELPTVFAQKTLSVTPGEEEYIYTVAHGGRGYGYEVSTHMVGQTIPQTFVFLDTSDGKTEWTPNGIYEYGKSNYDVTYCCDFETGVEYGTYYRRINLEDSGYFDDATSRQIRAIVQNAYPYVSIAEMKANLKKNGVDEAFVDSLTREDIIAGVQMAIWCYTNPEEVGIKGSGYFADVAITPNNGNYFTVLHDYTNEIWNWLPGKGGRTFNAESQYRVNNLIYYLCNLEGVEAPEDQVVISNIQIGRVDLLPRSEDVYSIGLHVLLNGGCKAGDDVTMRITSYSEDDSGNVTTTATKTVKIGKEKEYSPTINARYGDTVEVVIEGTQDLAKGVYFYEAKGGRAVSQSMVGVAEGLTAVHASESFTFNRDIEAGLRIYKKSSIDKAPISDITFHVYKAQPQDGETLGEKPTAVEIANFATPENLVGSVTTDTTGYAALELPDEGTYLVIEEHNKEKVKEPSAPFYISIPWPVEKEVIGENGTEVVIEYQNIVSVYPKNTPIVPPPPPPPIPEVEGQFCILKHDRNDTTDVLGGAKFQIYRVATAEDTETETLLCEGEEILVAPVMIEDAPLILTTDGEGKAVSPDLPCGTYYLKEIQAPIGYVLPKSSTAVEVVSKVMQEVTYVGIANDRGILLPETGGSGTALFIGLGCLLVALAALFLLAGKRLKER